MIVDAVGSTPVLAAGGVADGRGLAAALALGAQGALLGTRFLATKESPLHPKFKQAVLDSDGHDTVLTEIPDIARGNVWPGAMARSRRNAFIERWAGREWELRARQAEALAALHKASAAGDADNASLLIGQDAGLIHDIPAARRDRGAHRVRSGDAAEAWPAQAGGGRLRLWSKLRCCRQIQEICNGGSHRAEQRYPAAGLAAAADSRRSPHRAGTINGYLRCSVDTRT
jgi:hypothetical protein